MSDVIRIQEPSLADFAYKIAELAKQGYEVSGTNQGYPQSFGFGVYTCEMLKGEAKASTKPAQKQESVQASQKPSEDVSEAPATNAQETEENAAQEPVGTQKPTSGSTTGSRRGRRKTAAKK